MIAKIIIGFFAITGAMHMVSDIILIFFPKSKAMKFLVDYCLIKIDTDTYEKID